MRHDVRDILDWRCGDGCALVIIITASIVTLKHLDMAMAMAAVVEMLLLIAIHCDDVGGDFNDEPGDCDAYSAT